jgi:Amt family ammonium transporter
MAIYGTFVLAFGWFGFNAGSTLAGTDVRIGVIATNTMLAGAAGAVSAMAYVWMRFGKPDPSMIANGMLAGLVAITAPCAFVAPWAAAVIGGLAALIVIEAAFFIERKGIDDPVGAIAVHGVGGIFGVLCVGIFANGQYGAGWNGAVKSDGTPIKVEGLIEGKFGQFAIQLIGALVIMVVIFSLAYGFFKFQDKFTKGGIRSLEADEIAGVDMPEMGVLGYYDGPEAGVLESID